LYLPLFRIDIEDVLSCIAVSDEFRSKLDILFNDFIQSNEISEPFIIQRQNFSDTEYYYIELLAKHRQLTINRINEDIIHINK
jgi:hypothetical protein